ncbi:methionyl-tRNA synthetase, partial [mine drainage metagenome]
MQRILVNCALPYANSPLHLGHIAGSYLGADIFVRALRLMGEDVLFVCGTDEYGTPITIQADREHVTPSEIADRYHAEHERSFEKIQIRFDIFSRTTSAAHKENASELFTRLYNGGYLTKGSMISPYCKTCGKFMPDRYIEGTCPYCGNTRARGDQCDSCGRILDPQDLIEPRCIVSGDAPEFRET